MQEYAFAITQQLVRPDAERLRGENVTRLTLLRGAPPEQFYPAAARRDGIDGSAVVDLLINETGLVLEAQVISESPPDHGFGLAALDTVKTYEFDNPLQRLVLMSLTVEFLP
jgi:TonB family protein